jgi:DNA-binding beta-propeller fold protein YncE
MVRLSRFFAATFLIASAASAHQLVDVGMSFDAPQFVPIGQSFHYRVVADDLANDSGSGIVVTIVLPPQVKFSSVTMSDTWRCTEAHLTLTCSADLIAPGPNPIDVNVIAPAQPGTLHATASVQSLGSLDLNPSNDNASWDIVAYDPAVCTAAPPLILAPAEGASVPAVVPLSWTAVPGAQSYAIVTAVEGAAAAPALNSGGSAASLVAEPGTSEWWVVASFATCPPVASSHRHFTATSTLPRKPRIYAGDPSIDATRDGSRAVATFRGPFGLALSPSGEIYVADQRDNVVRKIANDQVTTIAGAIGKSGTTDGQFALFQSPRGLAVTPLDGYVYAADTLNQEVRILYTGGPFIPAFDAGGAAGVAGFADDVGDKARFNAPSGLAATERGNLYVADTANNRIRKMTQVPGFVGLFSVSTVGSILHGPLGVAVDPNEVVYVADTDDDSIRKADGSLVASGFDHPVGITLDARGNLFVTDRTSVYRIAPSGLVTTVVTGLNSPAGIFVDASDRIFVANSGAHTVLVIDPAQNLTRRRAVH